MNVRRGGLGRGLGALIPTSVAEEHLEGARFEELPIDAISPNPRQPRESFDPDAMAELVASIREVGVLQPVVVRELDPGRYQLIMGERRWRACREASLELVPAIIRETQDTALLRDALLENLHRQQLNALEEAAAYQQLLQEFGTTHEELADRLGRSRSHVTNTIRLLNLAPAVQRRVAAGVLSAGHARALLAIEDHDKQAQLADRVVAEALSVRAVEELVTVGSGPAPSRAPRTKKPVAPALQALSELLSERFETRVSVDLGRNRGKLVIEFATLEDLNRIVGTLAPEAAGLLVDDATGQGADTSDEAPKHSDLAHQDTGQDHGDHDHPRQDEGAHDGDQGHEHHEAQDHGHDEHHHEQW